jgi:hypothetical protein
MGQLRRPGWGSCVPPNNRAGRTNRPTYSRNCLSLGLDEFLHPPEATFIHGFQSCASLHRGALTRLGERVSLVQEH